MLWCRKWENQSPQRRSKKTKNWHVYLMHQKSHKKWPIWSMCPLSPTLQLDINAQNHSCILIPLPKRKGMEVYHSSSQWSTAISLHLCLLRWWSSAPCCQVVSWTLCIQTGVRRLLVLLRKTQIEKFRILLLIQFFLKSQRDSEWTRGAFWNRYHQSNVATKYLVAGNCSYLA